MTLEDGRKRQIAQRLADLSVAGRISGNAGVSGIGARAVRIDADGQDRVQRQVPLRRKSRAGGDDGVARQPGIGRRIVDIATQRQLLHRLKLKSHLLPPGQAIGRTPGQRQD
jgi:hypothetical protein